MNDDRRVVVIGSGPTGSVAALTLLRQGIPVTMLESGSAVPDGLLVRLMGKNVYRRRSEIPSVRHLASDDPGALWYHALVPGGLSNYWTGAVPRFAPEDFLEGGRLHEMYCWPISYEDLVPYYEFVESLLGVTGDPQDRKNLPACRVAKRRVLPKAWQRVGEYAHELGHGLTTLPHADVSSWLVTSSGAAFNSFTRIIPLLRRFPTFQLRSGSHVLRLDWSGEKQRVTSVTYVDRVTATEHRVDCAAVVLAAGALSSTKILLDSSCPDFDGGLGNTDGLLGHYLHDHIRDLCVFELDGALPCLEHNAYLTRGTYKGSPLVGASCTIGSSSMRGTVGSLVGLKGRVFTAQIFGTLVPVERNFVRLHADRKDEFGLPKLDLHLRFDDEALGNTETARMRLMGVFEAAGYRGSIESKVSQPWPGESVHYGGTVRMHNSSAYGMLNAWNRMHFVRNVVVADSSAFTTGPEKHPTLTAMAMSVRAADRLAEDLKTWTQNRSAER